MTSTVHMRYPFPQILCCHDAFLSARYCSAAHLEFEYYMFFKQNHAIRGVRKAWITAKMTDERSNRQVAPVQLSGNTLPKIFPVSLEADHTHLCETPPSKLDGFLLPCTTYVFHSPGCLLGAPFGRIVKIVKVHSSGRVSTAGKARTMISACGGLKRRH
jgi:hypothetical protein